MSKSARNSLKTLLKPYYIINILLSVIFILTKTIPYLCEYVYDSCEIDIQEYDLLIMMGCIISMRSKRHSNMFDYIAHACMFAKICNLFMFYRQNLVYAFVYGAICLLQTLLLKQPVYNGPDKVLYLRDTTFKEEVLHGDKRIVWVIAFFTAWSPACISMAPVFAELSQDYGLDTLKFAKLDMTRHPNIAAEYKVDTSSWSSQLPTIIVFKGGVEVDRRPCVSVKKKTTQKYYFNYENIVKSFDLNNRYNEQNQIKCSESKKVK